MADVPRETPPPGSVVIDLNTITPVEAGQVAVACAALPILSDLTGAMNAEDKLLAWAGAASAFTGAMSNAIGAVSAQCVLEQMLKMLPGGAGAPNAGELH